MKKILLGLAVAFNASSAFATAGFDWSKFSKMVAVGQNYSVMVSTIQFDDRFMAQEFCKNLGKSIEVELELADFKTIMDLAIYGKPSVPELMFQTAQDGQQKSGVMAWDNQRPLDKVIINGARHKDTNIIIRYRGTHDMRATSIREESQKGEFAFYNQTPVKKLPAVCQSVN